MTLLDMTQKILSSMDSDEVNSINDTLEATQVAEVIETTYYNIISGKDWAHLFELFQLTASTDNNLPTHMQLPDTYLEIKWIKYNKRDAEDTRDRYETVDYLTPEEFIEKLNQRDETDASVTEVVDPTSSVELKIYNDTAPLYYTSFDDEYIVFDAYDSGVDTTLTTAKTQCYGKKEPPFTMDDDFIPDLPVSMFSYLLNEAKATAFVELKQTQNPKAEQHSISQRRRMSQDNWRVAGGITYPNYGRRSKK
jgi:hypothetical protein